MMNRRDLDTLHAARAALRRIGFDTSDLDAQIEAVIQANEDDRVSRDLPPDPAERERFTLVQAIDTLSEALEDPDASVEGVRTAAINVCTAAIRDEPLDDAAAGDDPLAADQANQKDCALMLRTVRAIAARPRGSVRQGGYGALLDQIERSLVAIQKLHWDVGQVARDARDRDNGGNR